MHFAWPSFDQAEQYCTQEYTILPAVSTPFWAFKVAYTIHTGVNGGMSDWFICAQILKSGIAEDYTDSEVFLNFELSAPLMFPVEA
jgi:hypothetical protein